MGDSNYILGVDVGTSTVMCRVYDGAGVVVGQNTQRLENSYPAPGRNEIDPEHIWDVFVGVVRSTLEDSGCSAGQISSMGLCVQRNTFTSFDRKTGKLFHPFITWRDNRAAEYCHRWNRSFRMRALNFVGKILYILTRQKRYLAASIYKLISNMVTMRFLWMVDHNEDMRECLDAGRLQLATLDTWLVWRLTGSAAPCLVDMSCASATGMFDPFLREWGFLIMRLIGFPKSVLPTIVPTSHNFGTISGELFGAPIPIRAVLGDANAALFGCGCFGKGAVNITMGTGTFVDMNTGETPHASIKGIVPLVAWQMDKAPVFQATAMSYDTGVSVDWGKRLGLFESPADSAALASSVPDSAGAMFVPAFGGLQMPTYDDTAAALCIGFTPSCSQAHLTRAILEGLAFRAAQLFECMEREAVNPVTTVRCCGGVSRNDFVCELLSDLIQRPIERLADSESSCFGAAAIAGLSSGFFSNRTQLRQSIVVERVFEPTRDESIILQLKEQYASWLRAVDRSMHWLELKKK